MDGPEQFWIDAAGRDGDSGRAEPTLPDWHCGCFDDNDRFGSIKHNCQEAGIVFVFALKLFERIGRRSGEVGLDEATEPGQELRDEGERTTESEANGDATMGIWRALEVGMADTVNGDCDMAEVAGADGTPTEHAALTTATKQEKTRSPGSVRKGATAV